MALHDSQFKNILIYIVPASHTATRWNNDVLALVSVRPPSLKAHSLLTGQLPGSVLRACTLCSWAHVSIEPTNLQRGTGRWASLITVQNTTLVTDFGETGLYIIEKTFSGLPCDVLQLLCLNFCRFKPQNFLIACCYPLEPLVNSDGSGQITAPGASEFCLGMENSDMRHKC